MLPLANKSNKINPHEYNIEYYLIAYFWWRAFYLFFVYLFNLDLSASVDEVNILVIDIDIYQDFLVSKLLFSSNTKLIELNNNNSKNKKGIKTQLRKKSK